MLMKLSLQRYNAGAGLRLGEVVYMVEYRTRNREVAGSTHTRSTASNLEHVTNLLCVQANSVSYPGFITWSSKCDGNIGRKIRTLASRRSRSGAFHIFVDRQKKELGGGQLPPPL